MVELYYQEYKDELPHIGGYTIHNYLAIFAEK